jgi:dihydrolipoamide dehydrogenase
MDPQPDATPTDDHARRTDVAILGGGSAAEALVAALDGSGLDVTVFEPALVGGECPFTACMPSKSMLHDARAGTSWDHAVHRRDQVVAHLDDQGHADEVEAHGAHIVRERACIVSPTEVDAGGARWSVQHVVVATGATSVVPGIDGLDGLDDDLVWTSDDALTATERPESLVILGSGVIGTECAFLFSGFGTTVTLTDQSPTLLPDAPPRIGEIVAASLAARGIALRLGSEAVAVERHDGGVRVHVDGGDPMSGARLLVAVGRRPATTDIGLEHLGLDGTAPLPVDTGGRVRCDGSVWAIGDAAGQGQYTHLANHHARVVADQLVGAGTRRFDDAVLAACMFSTPPMIQVGPSWSELRDDDDVVGAGQELSGFPRAITDELGDGHLWVAARRSTRTLVAACGVGPGFDELVHALVVAIDGQVPVDRLRRSVWPFPTVGEILGPVFAELDDRLGRSGDDGVRPLGPR